jgi:hypothetical protein
LLPWWRWRPQKSSRVAGWKYGQTLTELEFEPKKAAAASRALRRQGSSVRAHRRPRGPSWVSRRVQGRRRGKL